MESDRDSVMFLFPSKRIYSNAISADAETKLFFWSNSSSLYFSCHNCHFKANVILSHFFPMPSQRSWFGSWGDFRPTEFLTSSYSGWGSNYSWIINAEYWSYRSRCFAKHRAGNCIAPGWVGIMRDKQPMQEHSSPVSIRRLPERSWLMPTQSFRRSR